MGDRWPPDDVGGPAPRELAESTPPDPAVNKHEDHPPRPWEWLDEWQSRFRVENDPAFVDLLINVLREELAVVGFGDERTRACVGVALSEALSNALYHGNLEVSSDLRQDDEREFYRLAARRRIEPPYRDRRIEVHARLDRHEARYIVRDEGPGFDVAIVDRPFDPEDGLRIGGQGLVLMRAYMDEVAFNDRGNQVTMVKRRMPSAE